MHAIEVTTPGGPQVLRLVERPLPEPGPGELRVRNTACGVNFIDIYQRTGFYPQPLPFYPGLEGAGTVDAVGEGVTRYQPGDRVAYPNATAAYAQFTCLAQERVVSVPEGLDLELAAAAMLQGLTAHALTHSVYAIQPGDTVLIHAAAGGAGQMLVQMAKLRGARVIATVSTEAKAQIARARGADEVILYSTDDFVVETRRLTDGAGVHAVYDSVGASTFLKGFDVLRRRGTMVLFGQSSGPIEPISPLLLLQKGSLFLTRPSLFDYIADADELAARSRDLFAWLADGRVSLHIDRRLPLADAAQAHELLASRATSGKLLLIP
ncbi:MAG: quinone oxidoreductase family protein [Immundisolibacter sp.]|uniref:quinone oxidoreductase family protein n=1 Tax=Immundisolibacter sp. TaxID=1934948 RepID=UPI003EE098F6